MKQTILIVEDEEKVAWPLKQRLEKEGFLVDVAYDGQEALKKVNERKPDLILLDLVLPVIDGMTVLKKLKKTPETNNIPVIVLTNLADDVKIAAVLAAGGTDYLIKVNYSLDEVANRVKQKLKEI